MKCFLVDCVWFAYHASTLRLPSSTALSLCASSFANLCVWPG
jgi:hypothetical protein